MSESKNRITELGLYEVSHNEGTQLVCSKRFMGEMHPVAYPTDGSRCGNDMATLKLASDREIAQRVMNDPEACRIMRREMFRDACGDVAYACLMGAAAFLGELAAEKAVELAKTYGPIACKNLRDLVTGQLHAFINWSVRRQLNDGGAIRTGAADNGEEQSPGLRLVDDNCA